MIVLNGRFAGRKAVVLKTFEEGSKDRKFGHVLIAGIERYPRKTTRSMSEKKLASRMKVKAFVKHVNLNHVMPTRYDLDIAEKLRDSVTAGFDAVRSASRVASTTKIAEDLKAAEAATEAVKKTKKSLQKVLEERYKNIATSKNEKAANGVQYFFRKLHF